ncbi:MAG: amidase [Acidimicrobiales bacterium]
MAELHELDASGQAELVASGQVSSRELADHAIARIESLNPDVNAVIWTDYEAARKQADAVTANGDDGGLFAGVPFLLKDIGATQAGLPHWMGNRALKAADHRRASDTELGSRFRRAGLITLGKTNLPELGSSPTTQPLSCGPTNNPWDADRSPAGSSGGAGAAVASGMVSIAHANDGGGSTRLPAAWCGLVGLKTTRGRIPAPEDTSRLLSELAVTKTVRDTARLLDAVHGPTDADLYFAAPPDHSYRSCVGSTTPQQRVAMITDGGRWPVDPECVAAVEHTAALLAEMGHAVEPVSSDVLLGPESLVNGKMWMAGLARRVEALGEKLGRPLTEDEVEPYNWTAAERGNSMLATEMAQATEQQQLWAKSVIEWMSADYDILLTPTSGAVPMRTEDLTPPVESPWKIGTVYGKIGAFTLPFNVTGQPAISLPLFWTDAGLPVGVQLVGGMGREDLLLGLAAELEAADPWYHRYPAL